MEVIVRINGRPARIRLRVTVQNLPAEATVKITDLMLQPGGAVSGWLPHTTEMPWAAGITG